MGDENYEGGEKYNTLSILSFVFAFIFFPVGFILGIISLSHIKKTNEKGRGLAIAAIVISSVMLLFLLLFFFVGIFWVVMRNVVTYEENLTSKCSSVEIVPTKVLETMPGVFDVTLLRRAGGEDYSIGGVKLVFSNSENMNNYFYDAPGNIFEETFRVSIPEGELENPSEVHAIVFFLDEYGNEMLCQTANQFKFA